MKMKKRVGIPAVTVIIIMLFCCLPAYKPAASESKMPDPGPAAPAAEGDYAIVDAHLHYVDFLQETDGFEALVKKMDETNVPCAILFGMAMAKEWDEDAPGAPKYYLSDDANCYYFTGTDYIMMEDYNDQPKEIQDRFFPFICGANTNDIYAAKHLRRVLETYPGQIYGIGELMSRHDDLTALTYGENPEANNPAFFAIYDLAAEYDIPVLVHHNIGPSTIDDPVYMDEMKEALAHNRKTNIIWAHTGISRRVVDSNHVENIDQMLRDNSNLYVDISWVVWEDYIYQNKSTLKAWANLIEKYPDRFMIGSDKVGHWEGYKKEIYKYYPLIDLLSDETRKKITQTNILNLIHVDPDSLPLLSE